MKKIRLLQLLSNERIIIIALLLLSGLLHGWNMFHFPYYENDEGVYMSQAWSLAKFGKLAPYTYWYDHAPAGWIFIALWSFLSGGFLSFGASVNSGRVLMLLLHLFSTYFLYTLTKRFTKNTLASIITTLFFAASPLGIYFQRRVLLDNIMTFWVLLSLWLTTKPVLKLRHIIFSAISFGIAVLTKENAIFFLPGCLYAVWLFSTKLHKKFSITYWLVISGIVASLYLVYAVLKTELFPRGMFGESAPHVSLIQTLGDQLSRGTTVPFWDTKSEFFINFTEWIKKDSIFIILGITATIVNTLLSIKIKTLRILTLLLLSFWLFLLRGKLVIVFYILPLLPFLAMSIGVVFSQTVKLLSFRQRALYIFYSFFLIISFVFAYSLMSKDYLTKDETSNQLKTIAWIKRNLPSDTKMIIDSAMYIDLHDSSKKNEVLFPNAEWAWKFEKDPSVYQRTFDNDWKNVQYIALSHEMLKQIKNYEFPLTKKTLDNSLKIIEFTQDSTAYRDLPHYISTNGDWMSIYKVLDKNTILLESSWQAYKKNYIYSYGQVVDPITKQTTSSTQAEAMLEAAWIGDRDAFDGLYSWTKDHFGYREDHLFSSVWGRKGTKLSVTDPESTTYADELIAFSLITAYNTWHDETYLIDAKKIIGDIWKKEVIKANSYSLFASTDETRETDIRSLQPAIFHTFALIDTTHTWDKLAFDTTSLLHNYLLKKTTADEKSNTRDYSSVLIAIAMDQKFYSTKTEDEAIRSNVPNNTASLLLEPNSQKAERLFQEKLLTTFNESTGTFGDPKDIIMQHQAFVITALHYNSLPHFSQN